jgi:hypothetical protein
MGAGIHGSYSNSHTCWKQWLAKGNVANGSAAVTAAYHGSCCCCCCCCFPLLFCCNRNATACAVTTACRPMHPPWLVLLLLPAPLLLVLLVLLHPVRCQSLTARHPTPLAPLQHLQDSSYDAVYRCN